jgi:dienelactone hydrolase
MPTIDVATEALRDEETPIRVEGLDPGSDVEIHARTDDWYEGGCASRATFEADADGVVDTAEQAPRSGDDEGIEPMGWLWSMASENGDGPPGGGRDPVEITLEARVGGAVRAEATTVRRPCAPAVEHRRVDGDGHEVGGDGDHGLVGDLFVPEGSGPHPGVLLLHGSGGRPLRGVASLLASHGFAAFAVQYFGDPDPLPDALSEVPVEYVDDAAAWLREREDVTDGAVGVYGQSKGAEAALVTAARFDWPGAVVAVAPTVYRWQALDRSADTETGSWTADGDVLPFVPFRAPPGADQAGNVAFADVYENSPPRVPDERLDAARIPVEDIGADVLLAAGGDDLMWPSAGYARTLAARLDERPAGTAETCIYDGAGHGISPPYRPTAGTTVANGMALGGTPTENARAAADYWPRVCDLFDRTLP